MLPAGTIFLVRSVAVGTNQGGNYLFFYGQFYACTRTTPLQSHECCFKTSFLPVEAMAGVEIPMKYQHVHAYSMKTEY